MTEDKIKAKIKQLPDAPGIYLFYNSAGDLVYVGKATSLKSRVRSYFSGRTTPRPIEEMLHEVENIKYRTTESVLEALILEANYIKKYQPKYNVLGKDDKSWNYIVITKGEYPRIDTLRQHEYKQLGEKARKKQYRYVFGPYPGLNTKATMKLLRKMFQFSTCKPDAARPCLYRQMGQCLGVCTGEISPNEYKEKVIKPLVMFLRGNKKRLIQRLRRQMKEASKVHAYEEAARLRDQIAQLERIHDIAIINKSFVVDDFRTRADIRIEGYDISNLGASGKVGSMVVFDSAGPVKSEYRRFAIKTVVGQSDVDCLEEVLTRRLHRAHKIQDANYKIQVNTWQLPDVILIDGGKPQVNRVVRVLRELGFKIPVVGIAKGAKRKKNEFIIGTKGKTFVHWVNAHKDLLIQVRDEAHRFAIAYQRKKRKI